MDRAVGTADLNHHMDLDVRCHTEVAVAVTVHHPSSERYHSSDNDQRFFSQWRQVQSAGSFMGTLESTAGYVK